MTPEEIETSLSMTADALGVSVAKTKAIYARGVADCLANGYPEPPYVHGLTRVQRFAVASATQNPRITPDSDFFPEVHRETDDVDLSYEVDSDYWPLVYSFMSEDGSAIAETLNIPDIQAMVYDIDTKELTISGPEWSLVMDMSSTEYKVLI